MPTENLILIALFSFAVAIPAVVSPGPVSAAIITETPRQGWRVGPLVAGGHSLLELGMVLIIHFGLSSTLATGMVRNLIAFSGAVVLLGLGIYYLRGAIQGSMRLSTPEINTPSRSGGSLFALGVVTTVSNPFWFTWWLTVAAGYLAQARSLNVLAVAAFYLGHISADFTWNSILGLATTAGRRWLTDARYRALILITGTFMLYLAGVFLREALST